MTRTLTMKIDCCDGGEDGTACPYYCLHYMDGHADRCHYSHPRMGRRIPWGKNSDLSLLPVPRWCPLPKARVEK